MNLNNVIAYGLLLAGALAFVLTNILFNINLNQTSDGKTVTLVLIWAGLVLAVATLAKMALEVWS